MKPRWILLLLNQLAWLVLCLGTLYVGFLMGLSVPREPTFSETIMKLNEIAELKYYKRCAK